MRIKDIAKAAGVSTATVSYVINRNRPVGEQTRRKVLEVIEQFNYYPNTHARVVASGKSNIIGLLISDISNPFFPELVKTIEAAVLEKGYHLLLFNTDYDPQRAADYVRRLIEMKAAGVALMTSELDPLLVDELARENVRVVFTDLGIVSRSMSRIVLDYEAGITEAVGWLAALGHRRIAHIAGPAHIRSAGIRRESFSKAFKKYLPDEAAPLIVEGNFNFDGGRAGARTLLESNRQPTAILAANDMAALGAMQELKEAGLSIPRDVSIVGFDDIAFAALADPPLSTVSSSRAEIGRRAIEALLSTIENPEQQGLEIHLPTYLIKRKSAAAPGQQSIN